MSCCFDEAGIRDLGFGIRLNASQDGIGSAFLQPLSRVPNPESRIPASEAS
jgi:hypothetical protein